jgi:hypothetical protein
MAGSITPAATRSTISPVSTLSPSFLPLALRTSFDHDGALEPRVVGELAQRLLQRAVDDLRAGPLVALEGVAGRLLKTSS